MRIMVNGTMHVWTGGPIGYRDVVTLAHPRLLAVPSAEHPIFSVTYSWHGKGDNLRQGTLYPTAPAVEPAEGMVFSAYHTGNA